MSDPKWTPGPWRLNKYGSVGAGVQGHEPIVAHVERFYGDDRKYGDDHANACLIAAAPGLYAALFAAAHALRSYEFGNASPDLAKAIADDAEALLAEARGGMQ